MNTATNSTLPILGQVHPYIRIQRKRSKKWDAFNNIQYWSLSTIFYLRNEIVQHADEKNMSIFLKIQIHICEKETKHRPNKSPSYQIHEFIDISAHGDILRHDGVDE